MLTRLCYVLPADGPLSSGPTHSDTVSHMAPQFQAIDPCSFAVKLKLVTQEGKDVTCGRSYAHGDLRHRVS